MEYGLTENEIDLIKAVFEKVPEVETVFIYGSRAKNTFKKTSDIDLAVKFEHGAKDRTGKLKSDLDDLSIIHEVDLTSEDMMLAGNFKDEYERTKQIFYLKGWKMTTLGEVAEVVGGGTPKTEVAEYWNGDIPWLSVVDFNDSSRWVYKTEKHITKKGLEASATRLLEAGDLIVSARGTVGAFAQLKVPMAFNQSCYGLRAKEVSENNFLYYLLKQNIQQLKKNVHGAVFDTITRDTFDQIEIFLPPLSEQHAITAVLSSLDNKIELLSEQNKILEATAQGIFKEWFVNFNFPGAADKMIDSVMGGIPKGWRVGKIKDLCKKLASGGTPATSNADYYGGDINWFSTKELQDNFIFESDKKITKAGLESSSAKVFPKGSVVMAIYAAPTVGRLGIFGKDATFNQAACGFVANEEIASNEYIYLLLLSLRGDFNNLANGAAQQNLNVGLVKNFAVIIPDKIIIAKFKAIIIPIFEKILNDTSQIKTLSTLRDALLPKLMKGEIRV